MNLLALLFARKEPILREQSLSVPKPSVDFATLLERMQKGSSTKLPQKDPLAKPQLWDTTIKNRPHPDIVATVPKTTIKDHLIAHKGKNFQDKKSKTFVLSHKPFVRSFISSQAIAPKSGEFSTKVAAKGAAPLAKSLETPKASQRFAKEEDSQTKNMDQVGQTPKTSFATLTKKQERTKIVEERPKSRPAQKDLAKGVAQEPATHMPPTQKEPAVQEPLPSNMEQKVARHTPSTPRTTHFQKVSQKGEPSVTKPSKKSLPSKEPTIPEVVQTHLDKEIPAKDGLMHHIAHPATHPSLKEAKKKSLHLDAKESPMAKTRSSGSKKKSIHLDEHPLGEELLQLSQKAEPITKERKPQHVEPSLHQSSLEDISNKTQHTAATQDSLDQGGQSFDQHQDFAHTEHIHPQEPEPQIPEFQKRILTIRLDQTHININLTAKQLSLTFFSSATFHTDGNLGEFVEEVMQQSGFDKYKVTLKDRQKRIEILSKESRTSSSSRSVIDVKV